MQHTPEQLDALWVALKSTDGELRSRVLARYSNPNLGGAAPAIVRDEHDAQVLSIPTPDHPGRHVYARKPGGAWGQEH
ncbi:hypothetical protein PE066_17180 [Ramlibacter tataouinensis]|uniref:hypothetical protein n=1 Tax=Ramlibacter tataouinensis TaxID=94132 RepID=UPI0022F3AEE4|nr:hypothetical protein [Ramlibacter tataouinensis]WBY01177.1 hypothetical protein PE066_17180 [Ramlibacter tataouinensis]